MADEIEQRRARKTEEQMRRGGLERAAHDRREGDGAEAGEILCDGCGEPLQPGENLRRFAIGGVFDVKLHDVCYRVWLNFKA